LLSLLGDEELRPDELKRLREMIARLPNENPEEN
jgi:hypothetical protein